MNPARIYAVPQETRYLDPTDLAKLEQAFRLWERASSRADVRVSRKRILLIFLLIRYTGARLNEVLELDLRKDIDESKRIVRYRNVSEVNSSPAREVQISSELMSEIQATLHDLAFAEKAALLLKVDAGHVRRKFYERAVACGFAQDLGSPNAIRRARAVELMQSNVPLPVVQRVLVILPLILQHPSSLSLKRTFIRSQDTSLKRKATGKPVHGMLFSGK